MLWLNVLGPLTLGGVPLRGRRRRILLVALLEARAAGRAGLTPLALQDLLYPGQEEVRAFGALRELVFALRRQFGTGVIERRGTLYTLGDRVASDLEVFLENPQPWLWRGPYLDGLGTDQILWARVYRRALEAARRAEPLEACRLLFSLLQEEPYDETTLMLLLRHLEAVGSRSALEAVYLQARNRFQEVGLSLPPTPGEFLRGGS
ncbi:hypothetical protein QT17_00280 [Thermus sp. 2.9]|nr:hypothetical protein QT17_00280 [Thermus sp. 2.9]